MKLKLPLFRTLHISAVLRAQPLLLLTIGVLFVVLVLARYGVIAISSELLLGCILSCTNAFLGYSFLEKAFRFDSNVFLLVSMAGMALRFFLMIASIALILLLTKTSVGLFIASFMITYTVFMLMEVLHINKRTDEMRAARVRAR